MTAKSQKLDKFCRILGNNDSFAFFKSSHCKRTEIVLQFLILLHHIDDKKDIGLKTNTYVYYGIEVMNNLVLIIELSSYLQYISCHMAVTKVIGTVFYSLYFQKPRIFKLYIGIVYSPSF